MVVVKEENRKTETLISKKQYFPQGEETFFLLKENTLTHSDSSREGPCYVLF